MINDLKKHFSHYISLFAVLIAGFIGFQIFSYDPLLKAYVAVAMAAGYVIWGLVHHSMHKDLYLSVVIEYVIFASLGLILVLSIIFRV